MIALKFTPRYGDIFTLYQHSYLDTSRSSFVVEPFDVAASPAKKLIGGRCYLMLSSHPESSEEFQ
ncbi:MAG: hypothetical protein HWQ35_23685 [Nostoc sp. NMS1]|uniref:hypothetical protein n=1 Tax=unclassified Nostoc TaxID=2593658 RepID=UPI0025E65218|nr:MULTISPECIES: hypothetical protein [unclassified Nostoc]MBN3909434.1 hypothetical protein [Nostoc sp. NMS1]MBN3994328.1 hypothetical protein [Nostoc sp. NMS2]